MAQQHCSLGQGSPWEAEPPSRRLGEFMSGLSSISKFHLSASVPFIAQLALTSSLVAAFPVFNL